MMGYDRINYKAGRSCSAVRLSSLLSSALCHSRSRSYSHLIIVSSLSVLARLALAFSSASWWIALRACSDRYSDIDREGVVWVWCVGREGGALIQV